MLITTLKNNKQHYPKVRHLNTCDSKTQKPHRVSYSFSFSVRTVPTNSAFSFIRQINRKLQLISTAILNSNRICTITLLFSKKMGRNIIAKMSAKQIKNIIAACT